jgi:iron complex transport system ATP-binding protein
LPEAITAYDLVSRGRYPHQGVFQQWQQADSLAVEEAMRLTGTLDFAQRPMDTLSGGQRQRCWIAMALAQQSQIILLDEPTTFLDIRHQIDILDLLARLTHEHGRTIVVVLHDLNFAAAYADYLALLEAGNIVGHGTTEAMFTPENIARVFSVPVHVMRHPDTGRPTYLPRLSRTHP